MTGTGLIFAGIFVVVLFLIGVIYTMKEFKEMESNPDAYRRDRSADPKIIGKDRDDSGSTS
jgi:hypothetical protein